MKALLKRLITTVSAMVLLAVPQTAFVSIAAHAQTDIRGDVCEGATLGEETDCDAEGETTFNELAKRIINIFSVVVGAVSVIMIIIGGFRYIISNGDSNGVTGAKNTILYAIVGLVIVLFAQVIVRFVLTKTNTAT